MKAATNYYLAIILLALYFSQSAISLGGLPAQALLVAIFLTALWKWFSLAFISRKPFFITALSLFLVFFGAVWLLSPKEVYSSTLGTISTSVILKNTSLVCLSLFWGYAIGAKGELSGKVKRNAGVAVAAIAVLQYFIILDMGIKEGLSVYVVNNGAYCLVSAIPFLMPLMRSERKLAIILFSILAAGIVWSGKRGAIVCMLAAALFFIMNDPRATKVGNRMRTMAVFAAILAATVATVLVLDASGVYFRERMAMTMDGYSSGRDRLYSKCLDAWSGESDASVILFGRGAAQTVRTAGDYAHSDWLELTTDTGIAGVGLYLLFFISYIIFARRVGRRWSRSDRSTANLVMTLLFLQSIFSMGFMAIFNCFDTLLLGLSASSLRHFPKRPQPLRGEPSRMPLRGSCQGRDWKDISPESPASVSRN